MCTCTSTCADTWSCAECTYSHERADGTFAYLNCQVCGHRRTSSRASAGGGQQSSFEESSNEPPQEFWHPPLSLGHRLEQHLRPLLRDLQPRLRSLTEQWLAAGVDLPTALDQAMQSHDVHSFRSAVAEAIAGGDANEWRCYRDQRHFPCGNFLSWQATATAVDIIAAGLFRRLALESSVTDLNAHVFELCWLSGALHLDPNNLIWSLEPFRRTEVPANNVSPPSTLASLQSAPFAGSDLAATNATPRNLTWEQAHEWPFTQPWRSDPFDDQHGIRPPVRGEPGWRQPPAPALGAEEEPVTDDTVVTNNPSVSAQTLLEELESTMAPVPALWPLQIHRWPLTGALTNLFVVPPRHTLPREHEEVGASRLVSIFRRAVDHATSLSGQHTAEAHEARANTVRTNPAIIAAAAFRRHRACPEKAKLLPWPRPLFQWLAECFDTAVSEAVRKTINNSVLTILFADGVNRQWEAIDWPSAPLPWASVAFERVPPNPTPARLGLVTPTVAAPTAAAPTAPSFAPSPAVAPERPSPASSAAPPTPVHLGYSAALAAKEQGGWFGSNVPPSAAAGAASPTVGPVAGQDHDHFPSMSGVPAPVPTTTASQAPRATPSPPAAAATSTPPEPHATPQEPVQLGFSATLSAEAEGGWHGSTAPPATATAPARIAHGPSTEPGDSGVTLGIPAPDPTTTSEPSSESSLAAASTRAIIDAADGLPQNPNHPIYDRVANQASVQFPTLEGASSHNEPAPEDGEPTAVFNQSLRSEALKRAARDAPSLTEKFHPAIPAHPVSDSLSAKRRREGLAPPEYGPAGSTGEWCAPDRFPAENADSVQDAVSHRSSHRHGPAFNTTGAPRAPEDVPALHASSATSWSTPRPQQDWAEQPPPVPPPRTWAADPFNQPERREIPVSTWSTSSPEVRADALAAEVNTNGVIRAIQDSTGCLFSRPSTWALVRRFESYNDTVPNPPMPGHRAGTPWSPESRVHAGQEVFRWDQFFQFFFGKGYLVTVVTEVQALQLPSVVTAVGLLDASVDLPACTECIVRLPDQFENFESGQISAAWPADRAFAAFDTIVAVFNVFVLSEDLLNHLEPGVRALSRVPRADSVEIMQAWESSGPALLAFAAARRLVGAAGVWVERGVFYDDFISTGFKIFMPRALDSEAYIANRYGIDLADGGTYFASGTPKKNKNESASEQQDLVVLGLQINANDGVGQLAYGAAKRFKVEDQGLQLLAEAMDRATVSGSRHATLNIAPTRQIAPRARGDELLSWLGKAGDLANADPFLATTLSSVYSILPVNFGDIPEFDLSPAAQEILLDVCVAVRDGTGRAAMPSRSIPDPAEGTTWVTLCDSSRRQVRHSNGVAWSVGAGGWIVNLATRIVIHVCFGWRASELKFIDISNLEGKMQEISLAIIRQLSPSACQITTNRLDRAVITYVHQLGDNESESAHLQNSFRGKAATARRTVIRRTALIRSMTNTIVNSSHLLRHNNSESDKMADNLMAEALHLVRLRFSPAGGNVHFVEFPAKDIPADIRDTSDLIAIIKAAKNRHWAVETRTRARDFMAVRGALPDASTPAHSGFADFAASFVTATETLSLRFRLPATSHWPGLFQDMPISAALLDDDRQRAGYAAGAVWDVYAPTAPLRQPRLRPLPPTDRIAAAFPFVAAEALADSRRGNPNHYVAAPPPEAMRAPDAQLSQSPVTGPADRSIEGFIDHVGIFLRTLDDQLVAKRDDAVAASGSPRLPRPHYMFPPPPAGDKLSADSAVAYVDTLRQFFLQRFRDCSAQAIEACTSGPNPMTIRRLLPMESDLPAVDAWLCAYDKEWFRSDAAGDDFNLSVLPDNGFVERAIIIRASRIADEGLSWDTSTAYDPGCNIMHPDRRILPIPWADPQLFTELKFDIILADITRSWFNGHECQDITIALEHIFLGFDVRSTVERCIVLVANTPDFFKNTEFVEKKTKEKMLKFATPRLSPGVRGIAIIPCFLLSNNVVLDQTDDSTGLVKPRLTCNPSGPAPPWSSDQRRNRSGKASRNDPAPSWADFGSFDPTVNGNHVRKVDFDYMRLADIAHHTAIFLAARHTVLQPEQPSSCLAVSQAKADMSSYYEALSRSTLFWHYNAQWVSKRGMQLNSRCCFGFSAEPDSSNRWAFCLCDFMNQDMIEEQAAWERIFRFARDGSL